MRKRTVMRKRYWRDGGFFVAGTFLGGWVFGALARLLRKV